MYITATTLSMDASQLYKDVEQRVSGLTSTNGLAAARSDAFGFRLATVLASSTQTQITCRAEVDRPRNKEDPADLPTEDHDRAAAALLSSMTRQVIGQPVHIRALRDSLTSTTTPWGTEQQQPPPPGPQTVSFTRGMVYSEASTLLFSAQGSVHTADGREISFDLGLSMEQHTVAMETASFGAASLFIDPLILQFDLDSPLLDNHSFLFDLDNDDELEELACPGGGCGFLAFDRNRDGRINDGSELFGPSTGWGFGELAELDSNANLWIDENDPMFTQLLIWTPDGQGGERLISLKEAGVGAIAVTHAGTDFQLRRGDGTVIGNVTGCGLFLTENGEVRPMQEVDLAITASTAGNSRKSGHNQRRKQPLGGKQVASAGPAIATRHVTIQLSMPVF
jgi:hypothetical protein